MMTPDPELILLTDCHTHRISRGAVVCVDPGDMDSVAASHPGILLSTGIHPWRLGDMTDGEFEREMETVRRSASLPGVAAIGETGLDTIRGGDLPRQQETLMRHIALSEELSLPLVLHVVRTGHLIIGLRKRLGTSIRQPWIWHGFRGNPTQAAQFCAFPDCYISLGPDFNPKTAVTVHSDRLLTETDDAPAGITITDVIDGVAHARGCDPTELAATVGRNAQRIFLPHYNT